MTKKAITMIVILLTSVFLIFSVGCGGSSSSDGSVTEMDSTTATADADGKIGFSFSSVPTSPDTNFLVLSLLDASDTVVRKSFVPAPPAGGTGELGLNELSTVQTNMILAALAAAGTDDPIVVAYGLILTRSPRWLIFRGLNFSRNADIGQIGHFWMGTIYDGTNPSTGGNPTPQQRQDANLAYAEDVELIMTSLSGTTDGATAISAEEKEALVRMMEHPNF
jgi:hypothetical protein